MSEQNTPPADQEMTWGGTQPAPKPRWSGKKTVAVVAVAIGVAAAGGIAVYAAGGSAGATAAPNGPGGMGGGGMGGPGGGSGGMMGALHGEFTISDGNGGYRTAIMQTGEVTAVSASSITAKSADGYTKVYTIDADTVFGDGTVSNIANGDTVTVMATPEGDKASADSVSERSQMPAGGQRPPGQ